MRITIGTFNLNNLFSRYNFKGEIAAIRNQEMEVDSEIFYQFGPGDRFRIRTYRGKLVNAKEASETKTVADRILNMNVDVLAVQEVEDIDTLREFNRVHLEGMYPQLVLLEGNDPRLIDVGLLSKFPLGAVTSWQHAVHPEDPGQKVFGRDLLEVQILNPTRTRVLFTVFNAHLKSHYVDFREETDSGDKANRVRRRRQSEAIAAIVKSRTRPRTKYAIVGDMNDPPDSPELAPFVRDPELGLTNGLQDAKETRPAKSDTPPPGVAAWTHRYKMAGQPASYELYDQIWLSPSMAERQSASWIDRRTKHGGDGSDHDPGWVEIDL